MKILIARHGETEWNKENRILGRTDIPLNDTGIMQAKTLKENIMYPFRYVIASPLQRAELTAKIICEERDIDIIYDKRLMEMDFGIYEGKDREDESYQKAKRKFFTKYPQGESYFHLAQRVYNCLDEIIERYKDGNVLMVTHNGICRVIRTYFHDLENEEFVQYSVENCGVEVYDLEDKRKN